MCQLVYKKDNNTSYFKGDFMTWHMIKLDEKIDFNQEKADHTVDIAKSDRLLSKLICYDMGQSTPVHSHKSQDEIFYVVEGFGTILLNEKEVKLEPTCCLFVPAGTKHGIKADQDSRLVITFVKSPGSIKK